MKATRMLMVVMASILVLAALTGCKGKGDGDASGPKAAAVAYATAIANHQWDDVIKKSTGDQLSAYLQLVPTFKLVDQQSQLKKVEVIDEDVLKNNTAFVTVRMVRNLTIPDYGSTLDDRQLLLSMKKLDGEWKVFRMDVVSK